MVKSKLFGILSTIFIIATLAVGVYLVGVKTGFIKQASGVPANLNIDLGKSFPNPADCWRDLAQGGESRGRMLAPVIPNIKSLRPEYIRIDHIFDNYDVVSKNGSGQLNFNWQNLDQTVQDIISSGATPFLSLSYMPPAISKDGQVESEPASWADWQVVVQKTVEHYSGRAGLNLQNVYYEVWNEPDLFGKFKAGGAKDYADLYYYAERGARSAGNVNSFKIGGPATTGLYKSWVDMVLKMIDNGVRVDFISWHNYSRTMDSYDADVQNILKWGSLYPNFANMELVVSELGINSEIDPAYDGGLSAIHTLASTATLQGNVNKCFNFEIIDGEGPTKLWGRWGLLTNGKFGTPTPKTRYYAIQFLNTMVGDRISVGGSGSWVKAFGRQNGDKIRILVVNYDPSGSHNEIVPFNLLNLPFRKFTLKRIDFLGGSSTQTVDITTSNWSTDMAFSPNTAAIFEITPN